MLTITEIGTDVAKGHFYKLCPGCHTRDLPVKYVGAYKCSCGEVLQ
jgi:hypothetical protein